MTRSRELLRHLRAELRGRALAVAIIVSVVFFVLVGVASNLSLFLKALLTGRLMLAGGLLLGIFTATRWYGLVLLVALSVLTGINVALVARRAHRLRLAGATGIGSLFGMLVGGCASCATGILPVVGLGAFAATLPFHGVELSVLGIVILLLTLLWNLDSGRCEL